MSAKLLVFSLWGLACLLPLATRAADTCGQPVLQHERKDSATIQALEDAWSAAYLQGDPRLMRCLLTPDFTEIMRSGELHDLAWELANAAQNQGKHLSIPPFPKAMVLIHGDVAVAYGLSQSSKDGKIITTRYADYYVWEGGAWHAYFAQQTPFGSKAEANK